MGATVLEGTSNRMEIEVAKKAKKKIVRCEYTKADVKGITSQFES
jgi:hypothetical protein